MIDIINKFIPWIFFGGIFTLLVASGFIIFHTYKRYPIIDCDKKRVILSKKKGWRKELYLETNSNGEKRIKTRLRNKKNGVEVYILDSFASNNEKEIYLKHFSIGKD